MAKKIAPQIVEENLNTCVIPENFVDTGRCFNGMFRTRNLLEGLIFAFPLAFMFTKIDMVLNQKIVLIAVVCGGILLLFISGINGNSVLEFVVNYIIYRKKKRVAKYNPRVKSEAAPGYLTKEQSELPRDKVLRFVEQFRQSNGKKEEEAISPDIYNPVYQEFFEDDLGIIDTPDDLKTKGELRSEAREKKREAKRQKRQEKRNAKNAKKEPASQKK